MGEKRLECLMMLQIHRSDTPSVDAVIDQFATTAARRLNLLSMNTCMYSTIDSFLNTHILNTQSPDFKNHINKTRSLSLVIHFTRSFWPPPIFNPGYAPSNIHTL